MDKFRILLTSDIHCTDLEDWYGVRDEVRMQRWLENVLAEHARHPFDLILIPGDISLDFHAGRTPFDKGFSTSYLFMKMYVSRLPAEVRVLVSPGNHDAFQKRSGGKSPEMAANAMLFWVTILLLCCIIFAAERRKTMTATPRRM